MMHGNPWKVESIQAFSCLKCPECTFFTKKENNFENHALRNHPLSKVLFDKLIYPTGSFQDYVLKEEIPNDLNHVRIKEEPTELSDYEKDPLNFCETTIHQGKEIWTDQYNDQAEGEIIYPHGQPGGPINMEIMNMPKKKKKNKNHLVVRNEYPRPHQCQMCDSKFDFPSKLKRHMVQMHDGENGDKTDMQPTQDPINKYNEINPIEGFKGFDLHSTQVPIYVSYFSLSENFAIFVLI